MLNENTIEILAVATKVSGVNEMENFIQTPLANDINSMISFLVDKERFDLASSVENTCSGNNYSYFINNVKYLVNCRKNKTL